MADSVRPSLLQFKLRGQLNRQSHLVPSPPISSYQAVNGLVTQRASSYLQDKLYIEMCETEIQDPINPDDKISTYYLEAAKYAGRISAGNFDHDGANAKHKPVFQIHHNDFTPRLQAELQSLLKDSPNTLASIVENAVFRIFKARHKLIFYEYIENEGLNWRFVAD